MKKTLTVHCMSATRNNWAACGSSAHGRVVTLLPAGDPRTTCKRCRAAFSLEADTDKEDKS